MKKLTKTDFPWERLEEGKAFFVPGLDVEAVKSMGLRYAVPYRYKVLALPGIRAGKLGVLFIRPRRDFYLPRGWL